MIFNAPSHQLKIIKKAFTPVSFYLWVKQHGAITKTKTIPEFSLTKPISLILALVLCSLPC